MLVRRRNYSYLNEKPLVRIGQSLTCPLYSYMYMQAIERES